MSKLTRLALAWLVLTVSATAAMASGKPVPGIDIIVKKKPGGIMATAVSDARGHFSVLVGEPGDYTILSECRGRLAPRPCPPRTLSVRGAGVTLRAGPDGSHNFTVARGRPVVLTGMVLTIDNDRATQSGPTPRVKVATGDINQDGQSDDVATAGPRGSGPGIGGQTQRKAGTPLQGIPVGLEGDPGSIVAGTGRTDASGNVAIGNLAPGRYFVFLADASVLRGPARASVAGTGATLLSGTIAPGRSAAPEGRTYALDANGRRLVVVVPGPERANARREQVVVNLSGQ